MKNGELIKALYYYYHKKAGDLPTNQRKGAAKVRKSDHVNIM